MNLLRRSLDALRSALTKRAGLLRAFALVGSFAVLMMAVPAPAEACGISDPLSCVAMIFVKIFQLLTALMGWILVLEVEAVIRVAQFFNFVSPGPTAVQLGWVVTRDLANMFFIVMLLIIAFGTILGSSTYHYSKNLQRLLIMAVVINFSKTICGLFIDMGQVVMLTFVNAFKETAAGNFMNAYQINKLLALGQSGTGSYDFGMVVAMMFAFILAAIAVCVTLVLLVMLLFRVVMLWILIILSPLAFLASAIPSASGYYADWWKEFRKYIISGPIIAFFMWLALASVQQVGPGGFASQGFPASYAGAGERDAAANRTGGGGGADKKIPTEAGTADTIMNMIIAICIMFAGLQKAGSSGVIGSGFANSVRGGITKAGRAVATGGLKMAAQPVLTGGGKMLARVPLVGGLGRAAVLKGESWKKERQNFREKFAGTPEDMARLSPGAFNRSLNSLSKKGKLDDVDKKRLSSMLDVGLKNPGVAASLGKSGDGAFALNSLIRGSKGKGLQDAVGTMMTDKNALQWAKNDNSFVTSAFDKLSDEASKDPNLKKTLTEFKQKFAPQLMQEGKIGDADLKEITPKMSNDDIGGLGKGDIATFMPHMTAGQLKKLATDGSDDQQASMLAALKPDQLSKLGAGDIPASWYKDDKVADHVLDKTRGDAKARGEAVGKGGDALKSRADARLQEALASGDSAKFLAALPDAVSVGSLSAASISTDSKLQAAIKQNADQIDLNAFGRHVSVTDPDRKDASKEIALLVGSVNPEKVRNARKGGMNDHTLPSVAEMEKRAAGVREVERGKLTDEAPKVIVELGKQVAAMQAAAAAAPSEAMNEQIAGLKGSMEKLQTSMTQRAEAMKSLDGMLERIDFADKGTLPMPAPELEALKSAAKGFEKRLEQLDTAIARTVADVKGVKFDTGEKGKKGNRPGGRQA